MAAAAAAVPAAVVVDAALAAPIVVAFVCSYIKRAFSIHACFFCRYFAIKINGRKKILRHSIYQSESASHLSWLG